jgi:hypothetical protein
MALQPDRLPDPRIGLATAVAQPFPQAVEHARLGDADGAQVSGLAWAIERGLFAGTARFKQAEHVRHTAATLFGRLSRAFVVLRAFLLARVGPLDEWR